MDEIERCRPRFMCILGGRYGWVPPGASESITALEVEEGALGRLDVPTFRYFYFRDRAVTDSIPDERSADYRETAGSAAERALDELKQRVRGSIGKSLVAPGVIAESPLPVFEYPCEWDPSTERVVGLEAFGERVHDDLLASVEAELGQLAPRAPDPLEEESDLAEAFVETHAQRYVVGQRREILDALLAHAGGTGGEGCLCVTGEPGSGKSALLAKVYRDYVREGTDDVAIAHFVGVNASDARGLLQRMCRELALASGDDPEQLPNDYPSLERSFSGLIARTAASRHVVLLIDAINQLEPSYAAHGMGWLPERLPDNARVIVSALEGPALAALRARPQPPVELRLPVLRDDDADQIVRRFLARYRKALDERQRQSLLGKEDARKPLYLLTAVEELRTLGSYDDMTNRIEALPGAIGLLFDWILRRLEKDDGFRDAHGALVGPELVRAWCSYVGLGRSGMTEAELVALVDPGDLRGNVAALTRLLRPYLMRRGELIDFFHGQLGEAVERRYLSDEAASVSAHAAIARHFASKTYAYGRTLSELAYHLGRGRLWPELLDLLTDQRFLELTAERLGPSTSRTGWSINQFLEESLEPLPPELIRTDRRVASMAEGLQSFSAALELTIVRGAGRSDPQARCPACERDGVVHGHVDLGGVEYYDNYFAWCEGCFWSWHAEDFSTSDAGLREFDRETSTYR
jgi:hypothetical protein